LASTAPTRGSSRNARSGMQLGSTVVRSLREGALWVFGALALIVLAALVTFDHNDPSFATTGEPGPVSNVIGPFGAHLSGLLVLLFGGPAFLFPVMIGFAGWLLYQDRSDEDSQSRATLAFRGAGFLITLITSCGLATLHFNAPTYPNSAGGVLGEFAAGGLEQNARIARKSRSEKARNLLQYSYRGGSRATSQGLPLRVVPARLGPENSRARRNSRFNTA